MGAIPFKPMLAKEGDLSKVQYPLLVQPKLDGIRASIVNGKLVSRTLKPIPNASIRATLERPEFEGLDGELIVGEPTASDCYRRTCSFVMAESKTDEPWAYYVFDKWDNLGRFPQRWRAAEAVVDYTLWTDTPIFMVECHTAATQEHLERIEAMYVTAGHEGVIARVPDSAYKFGRSGKTGPLLKVKRFVDFEAKVIGVYEELHNGNEKVTNALGRSERSSHAAGKVGKGTLGGLILVALNGPSEGVEFRCGTGFSAADRQDLWRTDLTGKVAKIKSFPIGTKDKPRHPVWLGWRDMEVDS